MRRLPNGRIVADGQVPGRTKHFTRFQRHPLGRDITVEYSITPEAQLSAFEKKAKTFAGPSKHPPRLHEDGLPLTHQRDSRARRSR